MKPRSFTTFRSPPRSRGRDTTPPPHPSQRDLPVVEIEHVVLVTGPTALSIAERLGPVLGLQHQLIVAGRGRAETSPDAIIVGGVAPVLVEQLRQRFIRTPLLVVPPIDLRIDDQLALYAAGADRVEAMHSPRVIAGHLEALIRREATTHSAA